MEASTSQQIAPTIAEQPSAAAVLRLLIKHARLLLITPPLLGLLALGLGYVIPKTYTARTSFIPPQQQQSAAAGALASLGALANLAGSGAIRTPADQYVALLESEGVANRIIQRFALQQVYEKPLLTDARTDFRRSVRVAVGRKDGLITVEVDDREPKRAADIANAHVEELRRLVGSLAITEAQQRRVFFEEQLAKTRQQLAEAQRALQGSGFDRAALQAEPKAAAEAYARVRAQVAAAEVKLQTLRSSLQDDAPEVRATASTLSSLRDQLSALEKATDTPPGASYVSKYREFKYQEAMFEIFARQYELARVDESRDGPLVQVVDPAAPPERQSAPRKTLLAVATFLASFLLITLFVLLREAIRPLLNTKELTG